MTKRDKKKEESKPSTDVTADLGSVGGQIPGIDDGTFVEPEGGGVTLPADDDNPNQGGFESDLANSQPNSTLEPAAVLDESPGLGTSEVAQPTPTIDEGDIQTGPSIELGKPELTMKTVADIELWIMARAKATVTRRAGRSGGKSWQEIHETLENWIDVRHYNAEIAFQVLKGEVEIGGIAQRLDLLLTAATESYKFLSDRLGLIDPKLDEDELRDSPPDGEAGPDASEGGPA